MDFLQRVNHPIRAWSVYSWHKFIRITINPLSSSPVFLPYFPGGCLLTLVVGRLNQVEYSDRIDPILSLGNGERIHLHNQLLAAIYGNLTREMPDQGLAPWVSANDKPTTNVGSKPVTGDAAERRLKTEVMLLPSRDRRRIKDLVHNDVGAICDMLVMDLEEAWSPANPSRSTILPKPWPICFWNTIVAGLLGLLKCLQVQTV